MAAAACNGKAACIANHHSAKARSQDFRISKETFDYYAWGQTCATLATRKTCSAITLITLESDLLADFSWTP